ncbi:MAG: hypothetical protein Kow00105_11250 [Phycisphaeraceae bacterium]
MTEQRTNQPTGPGPTLHERATEEGHRELLLLKNGQRFVFRCAPGEESKLLDEIIEMARDTHSDIQWFDAAMLSHQLGSRIADQLQQIREAQSS